MFAEVHIIVIVLMTSFSVSQFEVLNFLSVILLRNLNHFKYLKLKVAPRVEKTEVFRKG